MAKTNQTLFEDLADVRGILSGIDKLAQANEKYGQSAVAINDRIAESNKRLLQDMATQRESIAQLNVAQKVRQKQLQDEAAEAQKLIAAHQKYQEMLSRNQQVIDLNGASINTLKTRVKELAAEYNNLSNAEAKDVARKRAIETETRALNRVLGEQVAATKRATTAAIAAAGSYDELAKETEELRSRLRSMPDAFDKNTNAINRHNKAALMLQAQIQKNDAALKSFDGTMGVHTRKVGQYENALSSFASGGFIGLAGSLGAAGAAVIALANNLNSLLNIASQYERINTGLKAVTSDSRELLHVQDFLADAADRYGLSLSALAKNYTAFKANTNDTVLRGKEAERIFLSVAKASATLQLSTDDVTGTLRAFGQMLSKGTVQSEELKGQVGERLYNAFGMAAKAMGVTTQELNKMLEQGEVLAVDLLPKLATELDKTWGKDAENNVNNLAGATARLNNQAELLVDTLNQELGGTNFFTSVKNNIADTLKSMNQAVKSRDWIQFFQAFTQLWGRSPMAGTGATVVVGAAAASVRAIFGDRVKEQQKLDEELAKFQKVNASNRRDIMNWVNPVGEEKNISKKEYEARKKLYQEMRKAHFDLLNQEYEQMKNDRKAVKDKYNQALASFEDKSRKQQKEILEEQAKKTGADEKRLYDDMLVIYEKKNKEFLDKQQKIKAKQQKTAAERALREDLQTLRENGASEVNRLRSQNESGNLSDADFINQEYTARTDAALAQIQRLNKAGKQNTQEWKAEYAAAQKEITDAAADWSEKRVKLNDREFKQSVEEAKNALKNIEDLENKDFQRKAEQIEKSQNERDRAVVNAYAKGLLNREQMENRLHENQMQYFDELQEAIRDTYGFQKVAIESAYDAEINRLESLLKKTEMNAAQREKAESDLADLRAEKQKKLDEAQAKRDKDLADAKDKQSDESTKKQIDNTEKVKQKQQELNDQYFRMGAAAVNGYFDYINAQRNKELAIYQKQKEKELELAGDNDEAKKAIEAKYEAREKQYARQQAIRDKAQALFSIAIDTAQAVVASAEKPVLIPGIIALGAIQAAVVAARPIPAYKDGKNLAELDRYAGPALVGEAGRELHFHNRGVDLVDRPMVRNVGKDDVILPNTLTERLLTDENAGFANAVLHRLNIGESNMARMQEDKRQERMRAMALSINYAAMGEAVSDALQKNPRLELNIDYNGMERRIIKGATKTILRNQQGRLS